MSVNQYKKWLAFGTGVGIEPGPRHMRVTIVRVRPAGVSVLASHTIENYVERAATEWGHQYAALLKQHGAAHIAATVLLPRKDVIVRHLAMPGVTNKDLAQAVRFQ